MSGAAPAMHLRHQLPGYSPLSASAILQGARGLLPGSQDLRPALLTELQERTGALSGLLVDSGTSALRLALAMLKARGQVPVALPAFSCYDVVTAARGAAVPVVFYDVEPETLSPNVQSLGGLVEEGARSVVVAPLFGFPVDWSGIRNLTAGEGLAIVEDAAQSHGSWYDSQPWGSHGDLSVLSFGRGKGWTGGAGGALLAHGEEWRRELDELAGTQLRRAGSGVRHLALISAAWILGRPSLYGIPRSVSSLGLGETRYREPTDVAEMHPAAASVALSSAAASDREVEQRTRSASTYQAWLQQGFEGSASLTAPRCVTGGTAGYLRFPLLLRPGEEDPVEALGPQVRRLGVERSYPLPLPRLMALPGSGDRPGGVLSGAERLARDLVTLPTHSLSNPVEVCEYLESVLGNRIRSNGVSEETKSR